MQAPVPILTLLVDYLRSAGLTETLKKLQEESTSPKVLAKRRALLLSRTQLQTILQEHAVVSGHVKNAAVQELGLSAACSSLPVLLQTLLQSLQTRLQYYMEKAYDSGQTQPLDLATSTKTAHPSQVRPLDLTTPKRETSLLTISKGGTNTPTSLKCGTKTPTSLKCGTKTPTSLKCGTNTPTSLKCGTRQWTTPKSVTAFATKGDENDQFEAANETDFNMSTSTPESLAIYEITPCSKAELIDWPGDETVNCEVTREDIKSYDANKEEELPTDQHKITISKERFTRLRQCVRKEQGGADTEIIHSAEGHIGEGDVARNVFTLEESLLKESDLKDTFPVEESEKGHSEQDLSLTRTFLLPPNKKLKKTMLCWKCGKTMRNSKHADKRHSFNCPVRFCGLFFVTAEELARHRVREHKGQSGHSQGHAGEQHEQCEKEKKLEDVPTTEETQLAESCFYVLTEEPETNEMYNTINTLEESATDQVGVEPFANKLTETGEHCGIISDACNEIGLSSRTSKCVAMNVNCDTAEIFCKQEVETIESITHPGSFAVTVPDSSSFVQKDQPVNIEDEILDEEEKIIDKKPVFEENIEIEQSTRPILEDTFAVPNYPSCRLRRCGNCSGCLKEDCGSCRSCRSMCKFGGQGRSKQACLKRSCGRCQSTRMAMMSHKYLLRETKVIRMNNDVKHASMLEAVFSAPTAHSRRKRRWPGDLENLLKVKYVKEQSKLMMLDLCFE